LDYLIPLALLAYTALMALLALESRSLVYGAISLAGFFIGLSLYFFLLGLPYLAVFQLLVYVGAISVLILFAVMVIGEAEVERASARLSEMGLLGGLLVALAVAFAGLYFVFSFIGAPMEAALPILAYVGPGALLVALVALFLRDPERKGMYRYRAFGLLGGALIFSSFLGALTYLGQLRVYPGEVPFSLAELASSLLDGYGLLMVVLGLLLASAAYGAVALAKKEEEET